MKLLSTISREAAPILILRKSLLILKNEADRQGKELNIQPLWDLNFNILTTHSLWTLWAQQKGLIPFVIRAGGLEGTEVLAVLTAFKEMSSRVALPCLRGSAKDMPWLETSFDGFILPNEEEVFQGPNGTPVIVSEAPYSNAPYIEGYDIHWCQAMHDLAVSDSPYAWHARASIELQVTGLSPTGEVSATPVVKNLTLSRMWQSKPITDAYKAVATFYYENYLQGDLEPQKSPEDLGYLEEIAA